MTTRHTVEPDDQHVPVAATPQRRGAMYMRAEARRAAELGGVATAAAAPKKRSVPRRIQLAALTAVWLLIAGITAVVGVRWAREGRTSPPPAVTASFPRSRVAEPELAKPAPTPAAATSAAATSASVSRAASRTVAASTPGSAPNRVSASTGASAANRAAAAVPHTITPARPAARRSAPGAARLVVTSTPAGAVVTVDGIGWGATPAKVGYLPPGTKRVRVTKDGYASQETAIRVGASGTTSLHVQLRPAGR